MTSDTGDMLIFVTGADQARLISLITGQLAQHQITVCDLSHAVIDGHVCLGIVVSLPPDCARSDVLARLSAQADQLGLSLRFDPLDTGAWQHWQARQAQDRWIITLLARQLEAAHFSRVTGIVADHGMHIDAVRRLSAGISASANERSRASVEIALRGTPEHPQALRMALLETAGEFRIDIAFQRDDVYRRNRRLVAFDMDSTLIETEVIDELAALAGCGEQVAAITRKAMAGQMDFTASLRQRVALLAGLDVSALDEVVARLPVTEGAEHLLHHLRRLGYKTAILSGGFQYVGEHLQRKLGIDYVHANHLQVAQGKLTGQVCGDIIDGARKAQLLRQIAADCDIELAQAIAVGDGANDLPMLAAAGLGIAFRAKPPVRATARQSISSLGLDGILYLLGFTDADLAEQQ